MVEIREARCDEGAMLMLKGMTLEDISVLFGDPVELSFEQALSQEQAGDKPLEDATLQRKFAHED